MKQIILVAFLLVSVFVKAQHDDTTFVIYDVFPSQYKNLPTSLANSFEIPINKKFTIRLHTTDSIHFDCSVIQFERYNKSFNYENLPSNFSDDYTNNGAIEAYFAIGIRGEKQSPEDRSARIILVMKNRTGVDLDYDVETQKKIYSKDFKPAPNGGVNAGEIAIEMWLDMLNDIRLSNFRVKEN